MDNFREKFAGHRLPGQKFVTGSLIASAIVLLLLPVTLHVSDAHLRNNTVAEASNSKALPPAAIGDSVIVAGGERARPAAYTPATDWAERGTSATGRRPLPPPPPPPPSTPMQPSN